MRKTDLNSYADSRKREISSMSTGKSLLKIVGKGLLTVLTIAVITGAIVMVSVFSYVYGLKDKAIDFDLNKLKLNYTSFIYVNGPNDDRAHPVKYQSLYSTENRIWVDYDKIPQPMKDAVVSIEDRRFWEHHGVDWKRTFSAAGNLLHLFPGKGGGNNYGGSTITQQLIKNITGDDQVSITRKLTEIFRAINLEKKYSKPEILEAYLNVVNFGSGCNGVQAAANLYFGKNIQDCDIAECADIAGITQNPAAYSPFANPAKNRERQQVVLTAMHNQGKITDEQYQSALKESKNMKFSSHKTEKIKDENSVWNWYTDAMFEDVKNDLMKAYKCSSDKAVDMIYHGGLKIYSAMDTKMQKIAETAFIDNKSFPASDPKLQGGYVAMDYSGRVLALVGGRGKKTSNRLYSLATDAKRQPGSTIKPLAVYGPAINLGKINYSSLVNDEPLPNWKDGKPGPNNATRVFHGKVTVEKALEQSYNAAAAQICKKITPNVSYHFLKDKLKFTSLEPSDNTIAAVAVGGMTEGITVREMTAGFQMFGNGGKFYSPYTYYYVEDHDGNVILDNRKETPTQAISSPASSITRKLLNNVIANGTGRGAGIEGWDVFGKTGTTNDNKDSWFIAGTPYAVAGIWTGFRSPATLSVRERTVAKTVWKTIMSQYLQGKQKKDFVLDPNVVSAVFNKRNGLLAGSSDIADTGIGWYEKGKLPEYSAADYGDTDNNDNNGNGNSGAASGESNGSSQGTSSEAAGTNSVSPEGETPGGGGTSSEQNSSPQNNAPAKQNENPGASQKPQSQPGTASAAGQG